MSITTFDQKEETLKFHNSFVGLRDYLSSERNKLWDGCYSAFPLSEYLYGKVGVSKAMPLDIWQKSFNNIISSLDKCGTFEQYIIMLQGLFSVDVDIDFVINAPADLTINIDATSGQGLTLYTFSTDGDDLVVTDTADNIVFAQLLDTIDANDLVSVLLATTPVGLKVTFNIA